jgi:hypothetical protein
VGDVVYVDLGGATDEYVEVITADPDNETFDAIVTMKRRKLIAYASHRRRC